MNTLQRSSCSFRRQGSSGRIWHDHMQFMETKGNGNSSSRKNKINKEENVPQIGSNIVIRRMDENEIVPHSSKTQNKVHRSFLSSIFGRCMSSPTIQD